MKTRYTAEEISIVAKKLENEYEFCLTKRQVSNVAKRLEEYTFKTERERLLALEYSCKIKNEIKNYVDFNVLYNNLKNYYHYNTIDYAINRVLSVINNEDIDYINNNSHLESNILFVESLLRFEKNKKLVLSKEKQQ